MLDEKLREKMKEAINETIDNLEKDKKEKVLEVMRKKVFETINSKIEIKINSDGNKTEVKLEGNKLALLMGLERTKTKLIKDENISKEIADGIKNIAEKEGEENAK